jgi:hypothetical protein
MFCRYCGVRLPDTALFCGQCGARAQQANQPMADANPLNQLFKTGTYSAPHMGSPVPNQPEQNLKTSTPEEFKWLVKQGKAVALYAVEGLPFADSDDSIWVERKDDQRILVIGMPYPGEDRVFLRYSEIMNSSYVFHKETGSLNNVSFAGSIVGGALFGPAGAFVGRMAGSGKKAATSGPKWCLEISYRLSNTGESGSIYLYGIGSRAFSKTLKEKISNQ